MFLALALSPLGYSQVDVVIQSFDSSGQLHFNEVPNAEHYRIEWAPSVDGPWTNFAAASLSLDLIAATGSGIVTSMVPMLYRVVALVTNEQSTPPGMSLIPAGEFVMGGTFEEGSTDEFPPHTIFVSAFYMDRYEVTKALWDEVKAFNGGNGYTYSNPGLGKATNHPVHTVNWFDVVKWCNARSEMEGLTPVYYADAGFTAVYKTGEVAPFANWSADGYRLPTEAEWEKAARGGVTGQRFPWGDTISHSNANYYSFWSSGSPYWSYDISPNEGFHPAFNDGVDPYTSPVGYFPSNGYDLYDMAGNVFEWCWDWFSDDYYSSSPSTDPHGPISGYNGYRTFRGGSYGVDPIDQRVAARYGGNPEDNITYIFLIGFRCARGL